VDSAEHDPCAALARFRADLVAAEHVGGMNTDANDVALLDPLELQLLERFVNKNGRAELGGRGCGQHVEPAGGDDGGTERHVARINEINRHFGVFSIGGVDGDRLCNFAHLLWLYRPP
jgi:hypothetical protein